MLDLLTNRSDVHHVYPKKHFQTQGLSHGRYNQIANFVLAQSEINIAIGDGLPGLSLRASRDLAPRKVSGSRFPRPKCSNS